MTLWQYRRYGRVDHSRPTANTLAAHCEHHRISKKKMFKESRKPITLAKIGGPKAPEKIVLKFPKGTHIASLMSLLRLYYLAYVEGDGSTTKLINPGSVLLSMGLIAEHPLHPEDRGKYQITKLGYDYMNQICTRDRSGINDVPSNMGER